MLNKFGRRSKNKSFNPQRPFINEAVRNYLNHGGKITKIILLDQQVRPENEADKFLIGPDSCGRAIARNYPEGTGF